MMMNQQNIISLRMKRQHLTDKANTAEYIDLYRDMQPGQSVYWNGFGDPPSLSYRTNFNDIEFNRERQKTRNLIKGRFIGGNLGWIMPEDLELFAAAFIKPLDKQTERQIMLLELIAREGPLTIQQMKEKTGILVKEITPVLHRLQEGFLIYEDQYDGEWDRGWYKFSEMFPHIDLNKYSRQDAVEILLQRLAYRQVVLDENMAKSFYKLPAKQIKAAITSLVEMDIFIQSDDMYILKSDFDLLHRYDGEMAKSIYAMHRNDFIVKLNEHWLKEKYTHSYPDTLYYILIDGVFRGAVVGKFRYTPEVEDVMLDLSDDEAATLKDAILQAIHYLCGETNPIKRYMGKEIL